MWKVVVILNNGTKREFYARSDSSIDGNFILWRKENGDTVGFPYTAIESFEEKEVEE